MIEDTGLTIREYLNQRESSGAKMDKSVSTQMCELLTTSFDSGSCEGAAEPQEMCGIDTSLTFTRQALDWAYRQSTKSLH
jgi:hypothetical protein